MRFLPLVLLSAAAVAQSPLVAPFNANNGQSGNQFDLVAITPVLITGFDVNIDAGIWNLEVYIVTGGGSKVGLENTAAAWTLVGSAVGVAGAGINVPTPLPIALAVAIGPGATQGFYVTVTNGTAINYTNGVTPQGVLAANADLQILEGSGHAYPFAANFSPRNFNANIYYSPASAGTIATVSSNGAGCTEKYASFYEQMATAAFDLTDTDITGTSTGAGYVVLTSVGTGPLAVGGVDPLGGTVLTMGDDNQVAAGTLGMRVGSNGWFARGPGNSDAFAPTAATMLGNPSEAVYFWTDLQPNTSGVVTYEEDVVSGQTRVTFDGVNGWNTPDPCFIQCDFNVNSGDWAIRYGIVGFANPEQWLVGYSPAGANADPGNTDISAAGVIITAAVDVLPLTLTGIGRPVMGAAPVNYDVTTSNIEAGALIHVGIVGLTSPGTPLAILGFGPGDCFLNASLDIVTGVVVLPVGNQTWTAFGLPVAVPALNGFELNCQAATFDLSIFSSAGRSSNGLKCNLGDV